MQQINNQLFSKKELNRGKENYNRTYRIDTRSYIEIQTNKAGCFKPYRRFPILIYQQQKNVVRNIITNLRWLQNERRNKKTCTKGLILKVSKKT